ncbi:DUF6059 family protein [Kitasatospora purpeofusca]|uniref:DUF6059 family protein n=1 Tax=Kitasatospora purpeofusca TaxID=67352 RepID=UPI0012FEDB5A|nr:DUF6059 family protein [Kitasatospora purpeofusca]
MSLSLKSVLRFCANAIITYGQCHYYVPAPDVGEPAPGHPERMSHNVPLTDTERALARQLEGVEAQVGRGLNPI